MGAESNREHEAVESFIVALPYVPAAPSLRCHVTGRRSGCLCVTASGSFATVPGEVAAVRWDGPAPGTVAEQARLDVEELRPGFTLAAKRYAGTLGSAARVEPKVGPPHASPLEADLLLELDKAQEGTEGPLDTLRRLTRAAAETATLRARVAVLEAALGEALDEFEDALGYVGHYFVEKWGYRETLAKLQAALPAKDHK